MVFFGDSSTPSVINHVTVCSAEFMSSHNRSYSTKRRCLGILTASLPRLRCHLCVRTETWLVHKKKKKKMMQEMSMRAETLYLEWMRMTPGWWKFSRSGFLPWMVCVFFPPLTWQAVKCGSLWCVEAVDCIHAHRSRQPLIHWMTSHKRDKPVHAVVRALRHDMNRLSLRGFAYPAFFFFFFYPFIITAPQAICCCLL